MRVAFDVGPLRANPAGVGIYARSLARALAEQMDWSDLTFIGRSPSAEGLPAGIRSIPRNDRLPYPAWAELQAGRDAKRAGADVAHYTDGLVPLVRHGKTVVTVHDLSIARHWRAHRVGRYPRIPLVLLGPHLADLVIADSQATAEEVVRLSRISPSKVHVVLLAARDDARPATAAELAEVLPRHGLKPGGFVLVPGTIEPRKNHLRVLSAFEQLILQRPGDDDLQLVIAGRAGWGAEPVLRAIEHSPVRARVRHLGYVPDGDIAALMTGAACVAYVSVYEGFGLPVLEAMACGSPVVTSNTSSMPEAAGDAGFLVDPNDVADITRGLADALLANRNDVARQALERARSFRWSDVATQTLNLYRTLA
jgi:glycosyltransferase involved in cell wall biosynthesis